MASSSSIGPHIPAQLSARKEAERREPHEAGPSVGSVVPPAQARLAAAAGPVPRYEEEEEDEDEDDYVPELPPDLAAARANPSFSSSSSAPHARRPIGPARGPLRREEEEEESEDEDEIGPAPLPPAGTGSSHAHEDAVIEFMQKEAQRRQAIEVRLCVLCVVPLHLVSSLRVFRCCAVLVCLHLRAW
jgi:hypothetical protein